MPQATTKHATADKFSIQVSRRLREAAAILLAAVAIYLFVALFSYNPQDPAWSHVATTAKVSNAAGKAGAWFADTAFFICGYIAFLFPTMILCSTFFLFYEKLYRHSVALWVVRAIGAVVTLLSGCGLASLHIQTAIQTLPFGAGGILGNFIGPGLIPTFNFIGTTVILLSVLLIGITLFAGISWLRIIDFIGRSGWLGLTKMSASIGKLCRKIKGIKFKALLKQLFVKKTKVDDFPAVSANTIISRQQQPNRKVLAKVKKDEDEQQSFAPLVGKDKQISLFNTASKPAKIKKARKIEQTGVPDLDLLDANDSHEITMISSERLEEMSRLVETKLLDFGLQVQVKAVHPGPVVTRFELELAPGIKVSRLSGLAKDLARSLSIISVRVVEVIPGKSWVGLEIPNEHREMVRLREILESEDYQQAGSSLSMALGKDISGQPVIVNLAKMPHLLVAGTTGSGKSVGLNAMLISLLYKSTPDDVRLILVDPKMLELAVYEGIPHLLTPVVTDMKDAAQALRWCVAEMERRYKLMASLGVRNITGFNKKVKNAIEAGEPIADPLWPENSAEPAPTLDNLPFIVVLIDEFADMMMVVGKKVEELIARIAQKARAAGIHLILATQRPSVDVITGLIKANIPTRISFQVSSRIDSRTILDQMGAEQLLGHGDMLYLAPGTGIPTRVHGAFISDEEVHSVVAAWKERGSPEYIESLSGAGASLDFSMGAGIGGDDEEIDELFDHAIFIVTESRKASISNLQRRLKIGYNRAARLIETMEEQGIVSAPHNGGNREVLAPPPPAVGDQ